jgi:hypothetical protein
MKRERKFVLMGNLFFKKLFRWVSVTPTSVVFVTKIVPGLWPKNSSGRIIVHCTISALLQSSVCMQFCNHVFEYHMRNSGGSELTMEDAKSLTCHSKSVADEMIATDDPMIAKNCQDLLGQVLAED